MNVHPVLRIIFCENDSVYPTECEGEDERQ